MSGSLPETRDRSLGTPTSTIAENAEPVRTFVALPAGETVFTRPGQDGDLTAGGVNSASSRSFGMISAVRARRAAAAVQIARSIALVVASLGANRQSWAELRPRWLVS